MVVDTGETIDPGDVRDPYDPDILDVEVADAVIWNGISSKNNIILFTAMSGGGLYLFQQTLELEPVRPGIPLIRHEDFPGGFVTDHAQVFWNDLLYVTVSDPEAQTIHIAAFSADGEPVLSLQEVPTNGWQPTNDMHLFTDGELLYISWGRVGPQRHQIAYSRDLEIVDGPYLLDVGDRPADQLGSTIFHDNSFWMVSGNFDNRELQLTRWDEDWEPVEQKSVLGIGGEAWNWSPTGITFDEPSQRWLVVYTYMPEGVLADESSEVRMTIFNTRWEAEQTLVLSEPSGFTRPHVLSLPSGVYVSYDKLGTVNLSRLDALVEED